MGVAALHIKESNLSFFLFFFSFSDKLHQGKRFLGVASNDTGFHYLTVSRIEFFLESFLPKEYSALFYITYSGAFSYIRVTG